MENKILIVEPDQECVRLLTFFFQEIGGFEVTATNSLKEALRMLASYGFGLIITEAFGQRDNYRFDATFLEELKAVAGNTPICLSSIYPSTDHLRPSDYGLAANVPKPFDIDALLEIVQRLLRETAL